MKLNIEQLRAMRKRISDAIAEMNHVCASTSVQDHRVEWLNTAVYNLEKSMEAIEAAMRHEPWEEQ